MKNEKVKEKKLSGKQTKTKTKKTNKIKQTFNDRVSRHQKLQSTPSSKVVYSYRLLKRQLQLHLPSEAIVAVITHIALD